MLGHGPHGNMLIKVALKRVGGQLDPLHHWLIIVGHVNWVIIITNNHLDLCPSLCVVVPFL